MEEMLRNIICRFLGKRHALMVRKVDPRVYHLNNSVQFSTLFFLSVYDIAYYIMHTV